MAPRPLASALLAAAALVAAVITPAPASAGSVKIADNCAPAASATDGTMVFNRRNARGDFDAFVARGASCDGPALLPAWDGHRGAADMTADGRYVLLTTAVGWDRHTMGAQPGKGSMNAVQLYDRRTDALRTVVPAACKGCQRGVLWPRLSPDGRKLVWAEMVAAPFEAGASGRWRLHVADLELATGTLTNDRSYEDPTTSAPAIYEPYGWIPGTDRVVFMSTSRMTGIWTQKMQLFTLPDTLPRQAPTRVSPPMAPSWSFQRASNAYHEFASFKPGADHTMYTSIGTNTVGGADLFAYDLRGARPDGLLGQPRRVSYFGGDMNRNYGTQAIAGYPAPRRVYVGGMAWTDGAWAAGVCRDINCQAIDAWRITDD